MLFRHCGVLMRWAHIWRWWREEEELQKLKAFKSKLVQWSWLTGWGPPKNFFLLLKRSQAKLKLFQNRLFRCFFGERWWAQNSMITLYLYQVTLLKILQHPESIRAKAGNIFKNENASHHTPADFHKRARIHRWFAKASFRGGEFESSKIWFPIKNFKIHFWQGAPAARREKRISFSEAVRLKFN